MKYYNEWKLVNMKYRKFDMEVKATSENDMEKYPHERMRTFSQNTLDSSEWARLQMERQTSVLFINLVGGST